MDRLGRHFVEQGLDVRAPAALGSRRGQAMHKVVRADGLRAWRVDRCKNRLDLTLGNPCAPVGFLELPPDELDVVRGCNRHLDLDACDASLRFLERAVALHAAGNGPVGHDPFSNMIIP